MATLSFFRNPFRYMRHMSHESPTIFWSLVIGAVGPVMVVTVPPIRRSLGYVPAEHFPTSYPLPQRARQPVSGYDDE